MQMISLSGFDVAGVSPPLVMLHTCEQVGDAPAVMIDAEGSTSLYFHADESLTGAELLRMRENLAPERSSRGLYLLSFLAHLVAGFLILSVFGSASQFAAPQSFTEVEIVVEEAEPTPPDIVQESPQESQPEPEPEPVTEEVVTASEPLSEPVVLPVPVPLREPPRPVARVRTLNPPRDPSPDVPGIVLDEYKGIVAAQVARYRPAADLAASSQGMVLVSFTIDANGVARDIVVAKSSGHDRLDQAGVRSVQRASPFPPPPSGRDRSFTVPIRFQTR